MSNSEFIRNTFKEQRLKPIPYSSPEIGIDTEHAFYNSIIGAAQVGSLDVSSIDALSQSAQNREQAYALIDSMAQDDVISSVLEIYAENVVQENDKGDVIWIESQDAKVLDYTSWLLDSLNIQKHLYQWAYCLVTYGDVYLRLYRQSDVKDDLLFKNNKEHRNLNESKNLNEDATLRVYDASDRYIPYVQMVDNPGEMFDLQRFGKTQGYIKAPVRVTQQSTDALDNYLFKYKMRQSEVEIFDATSFVHGCIESTNQRQPETVDIYLDNGGVESSDNSEITSSYQVKRGQSILYNSFRIWRELNLLEMSALLNRLTKSSVVRVLNIDIGDMSKDQVQIFLQRLKDKIEQKSALNIGAGMAEYTNPAPIENTIYVPTHGTQGQITPTTIGGDFDPKSLVDIEYFRDKLFGALRIPKQYLGFTEDGAGFNGGTALTILSSRFGISVKMLQQILRQVVTDVLNLFLIDRGLDAYVNKFTVRMQQPITQEELDYRANTDTRLRYIGDLMNQLTDIDDKAVKLKIYRSLLSDVVSDQEVMLQISKYIETLEAAAEAAAQSEAPEAGSSEIDDSSVSNAFPEIEPSESSDEEPLESFTDSDEGEYLVEKTGDEEVLPMPKDLGIDFSNDMKG